MTSQVRNLCRSIGVREATDLIRMVSVSGRVGGVVVGVGVVLIGWHCAN